MTARQIIALRHRLEDQQRELMDRMSRLRERLEIDPAADVLDRVCGIYERELLLGDLARESRILSGVREALREISAGTFGVCAACNAEIPLRRLEAVPWSPFCVRCQESTEAPARAMGQPVHAHS